jgi:hypothetical protein
MFWLGFLGGTVCGTACLIGLLIVIGFCNWGKVDPNWETVDPDSAALRHGTGRFPAR